MQTMDVEYSIFVGHGTRITTVNVTIHWVIVVFRAVYIYILVAEPGVWTLHYFYMYLQKLPLVLIQFHLCFLGVAFVLK